MSVQPNLALGILITLFHMILDETILAVHVVSSYGESINFFANCDAHMVGIILLGPMVYDNVRVVDNVVFGDAPDVVMGEKKIVLVPTVVPTFPCASLWSSLDIVGTQSGLRTGSCMSFVYFMMVSLVAG
jgi:hypothetical protein